MYAIIETGGKQVKAEVGEFIFVEKLEVAEGERMYASRFMGDKAYLVTYRNTDPLFAFDISNPKKPKLFLRT